MHGLKSESRRMRMKGSSSLQSARPQNSAHGVCPVCKEFREDLRQDGRCHDERCEDLLQKKCIEAGCGARVNEGGHVWVMIHTGKIIDAGLSDLEQLDAEDPFDDIEAHTCACGRGLCRPRAATCAACYAEGRVMQARAEREERIKRQRARLKAQRRGKVTSKIRGLEKLRRKL